MAELVDVVEIAPAFKRYLVHAPEIARKHQAGQFVIVLLHDHGERIPLTIAGTDVEAGTITLVVQEVGKTTMEMGTMRPGDSIEVVGPLGSPTHIEQWGTVVCVGGGAGIAPLLPIAKAVREAGNHVVSILGGRTLSLVILREEMAAVSDEMLYTTDDGSFGRRGLVTHALQDFIDERGKPGIVFAIGPALMMKAVAELTRPLEIPTVVSLNTIMIDGTGMCGGCRVTLGDEVQFACVDGPCFDGSRIDWEEMMSRLKAYAEEEKAAWDHWCKLREAMAADGGER
jgi:ferredoxin--NADP+ reductase